MMKDIPTGDDVLAAIDHCYEMGWAADGLPVVPPEQSRVAAMAAMDSRPADTVLASHAATGMSCTIANAAVNAVMAGCRPEYFPVVVAALEAMDHPDFTFHGSTASTGGSAHLLVVSGPVVHEIGMNADGNVLGPGNRANATIGRAIRLIIMNVFEMLPGITDQSTQGTPAKYSACVAERQDVNPWEPLNVELGHPPEVSTVTVFAGSGFINCENHGGNTPEAVLGTIADAMANLGTFSAGQSVVLLAPEHVGIIAAAGWSKARVRQYLYDHARRPSADLVRLMKASPASIGASEHVHRGKGPDDILVTVAGGLAGGHSTLVTSWSRGRASIMQTRPIRVRRPD